MAQAKKRKKRASRQRGNPNTGHAWGMLLIGLVCGAVLSGLYFGYRENEPGRFGSGIASLLEEKDKAGAATAAAPAEPDKPEEAAPKVKLDFHEVLPNIDEVIAESEIVENEEPVEDRPDRLYILQAGSYRNERDAESVKAKLALSGFEAVIQRVNINDKGTYYRVRMGPYQSRRTLQRHKKQLADQGINALALRLERPAEQARQSD